MIEERGFCLSLRTFLFFGSQSARSEAAGRSFFLVASATDSSSFPSRRSKDSLFFSFSLSLSRERAQTLRRPTSRSQWVLGVCLSRGVRPCLCFLTVSGPGRRRRKLYPLFSATNSEADLS